MPSASLRRARCELLLAALTLFSSACGDDSGDPVDAGPDAGPADAAPATTATPARRSVTLITGDRVIVHGDGSMSIEPAPGRSGFHRYRAGGHDHVVPADAAPLLASGALDRRLFDVTALLELGYHDEERADLPLLISYRPGVARRQAGARLIARGARITRELATIDGAAMRAPKGGALWSALAADAGPSGAIARIWLDGRRRLSLDASAAQIGAPAAWQAGLTGHGVTVAVLDSGIAAEHPDLAGRIAESRSFLEWAPDATDDIGHGTHVASILAGSGAGQDGTYRGVAPEASLLIGKVCDFGCPDSAVLAGMEWAVASGARVVNMSFGGPDSPEIDPLEQAIDSLTAQHGTLFVVSAGNTGQCGGRSFDDVSSPATADAALAVAAIDRAGAVADFSCRGPRAGDLAIKPELSGPGVGIVAARAAGTPLGDDQPVGDLYARMSGTSQAAPHVAGAAALLAELHPEWRAAELKAALIGSASAEPELDLFRGGAGRVDVARAIAQEVVASPASLSLGQTVWPHDDDQPIVRAVTYHNHGAAPITLELAVGGRGPDGAAAPAGMFAVAPGEISVPPGGQAEVSVTVDTRVPAPDGQFAAVLIASAASLTVRTPIAVAREVEHHDLELVYLDRDGKPTTAHTVLLDLGSGEFAFLPPESGSSVRLPRGRHHLESTIHGTGADQEEYAAVLVRPEYDFVAPSTIVFDARVAQPIRIGVPREGAGRFIESADYERDADAPSTLIAGYSYFGDVDDDGSFDTIYTAHLGPPVAPDLFRTQVQSVWAEPGPADGRRFDESPTSYHLVFFPEPGRFPTGWSRQVSDRDLATVHSAFAAEAAGLRGQLFIADRPRQRFPSHWVPFFHFPLPARRTTYHITDGTDWRVEFTELDAEREERSILLRPTHTLEAGRSYHERWNGAVFGPTLRSRDLPAEQLVRLEDDLIVNLESMFGDGADHLGESAEQSAITRVFRDGALIAESEDFSAFARVTVPPEEALYRVEVEATRGVGELSSEVQLALQFRSAKESDDMVPQPALAVRFSPILDDLDRAPAGRLFAIPVAVSRQAGAPAPPLRRMTVAASYDRGQSWHPALVVRIGDFAVALVHHPDRAGLVSLRAAASDADDSAVETTILDAYRIR